MKSDTNIIRKTIFYLFIFIISLYYFSSELTSFLDDQNNMEVKNSEIQMIKKKQYFSIEG